MKPDLSGVRATVMGLGVHGGGLNAVRYLVDRGAEVTVTDLRAEEHLAAGLRQLPPGVRTVIGTHQREDFHDTDVVIKNPAVPRTAPMLQLASAITTDIALFFAEWCGGRGDQGEVGGVPNRWKPPGPLVAVTGTKGKSSTSAATAHLLHASFPGAQLGGNITVSPLSFVEQLADGDPVVLELSSFQLGDIAFCRWYNEPTSERPEKLLGPYWERALHPTLPAKVAIITNIFRDHQDYYASMEAYVEDKREVYRHLVSGGTTIFGDTADQWGRSFVEECRRRYGDQAITVADTAAGEAGAELLPEALLVAGEHSRGNLRIAAIAAKAVGVPPALIHAAAATYTGVRHRLETVATLPYGSIVNDSAATIPEAALAAVRSFPGPVLLIAGGSDKGLDPTPLITAADEVVSRGGGIYLLAGSATTAITGHLRERAIPYAGPFDSLERAFSAAKAAAQGMPESSPPRDAVILLSPGCASFGMFANEFDRGDQFRALAQAAESTGDGIDG